MYKHLLILVFSANLLSFTFQQYRNEVVQKSTYTQADSPFRAQLTAVYKSSQQLKEALVESDSKKAQQVASEVKRALSQVDVNQQKDKAYTLWMTYQKDIKSSLDKIESEDKLKLQLKYFAQFNEALYKSIKAFGVAKKEVYYQHCPMALEGQGAYWLSDSKQIRNPYLGDNMLTCGSTKEIIR